MKEILLLEDLDIYQLALEIGECVWNIAIKWEYFSKKTIGSQFTEAADSVAANRAEGYGRALHLKLHLYKSFKRKYN